MEKGLYVALSGAVAQQTALDGIAHSVANVSTPGFRAPRTSFAETLKHETDRESPQVRVDSVEPDNSAGPIRTTGRPLDAAISGEGYFAISTPHGVRYTRGGEFQIDPNGRLVNTNGFPVLDKNGDAIEVPAANGEISISASGAVLAGDQEVGHLGIATIAAKDLVHEGQLLRSVGGVTELEHPDIVSGAIEGSNLNVVHGMVELVRVQRTYEALTRMIEGYKEIDQRTARDLGTPR